MSTTASNPTRAVQQADAADHASSEVLARVASDLADRYAGVFSPETVGRYVRESHDLLVDHSPLTRFVPSRTATFAAIRLEALATEAAPSRDRLPRVLFVCVQNSGRSQLAAAMLKQLAGDRVRVRSAGSRPASTVKSTIITALDEIGLSLGGEFPKPLTDEVVRASDVVVTMGCGDACPVYPGTRYLDWELEDPAGLPIERVREIRSEIERRVRGLVHELEL
ncbi:MAG TPA: arsenate reductase ArsC [Agromyces mariniharenae]|nr:arsenate reductase ArsC [Agromyces mariniharenae]